MSKDIAKLIVKLEAQTNKYDEKLAKANKTIKRFHAQQRKSLKGIAGDFKTILGGVAVGLFTRKIIDATKTQEQAVAQLEQGLATTGNAVGYSLEELTKKAAELQKATTFGDEGIIQAMSQLVTFTGITKEQFDRTTVSVLDLATRMDGDLKGSVVQLGKALNDPVANLSALSRSGIQFSQAQKSVIKDLVESNKLMEAQDIILTELEKQFGGSAKAARDTFGGALDGLSNAFGDLFEASTDLDDARLSVEELTATLQDEKVVDGINKLISGMVKLAAEALKFSAAVARGVSNITSGLSELRAESVDTQSALKQLFNEFSGGRVGGPSSDTISDNVNLIEQMLGVASEEELEATLTKITGSLELAREKLDNALNPDTLRLPTRARDGAASVFNTDNIELEIDVYKRLRDAVVEALETKEAIANVNTSAIAGDLVETLDAVSESVDQLADPDREAAIQSAVDGLAEYNAELVELADQWSVAYDKEETFKRGLEQLNAVMATGALDAKIFTARFEELKQELDGLPDETNDATSKMQAIADQAARNMQDAFANFLFDPLQDGLDGMLKGFIDIIRRMAAEQLAANIFGGLTALFGTPVPGGAPVVDGVPTMNGGGFTGNSPRVGGVDGLGGFMAILHPNETVIDHTLQGSANGGNQITIAPQFSLSAIDSRGMGEVIAEQQGAIISVIDSYLNEKGVASL